MATPSLSRQIRDKSVSESCNAYVIRVGEICFDSLEFCPVGCNRSMSLLDFLEFLECDFLCIYLAKRMPHVSFLFFPD